MISSLITTGYHYNKDGKLSEKYLPDEQVLVYHYYEEGKNKGEPRAITRKGLFGLTQTTLVGEIDSNRHDGNTGHTYHNGLRTEVDYDSKGRATAIQTDHTQQLVYQYNEAGQIISIDQNGQLNQYGYDQQGRLVDAVTPLGTYRYRYDNVGNRAQKQHTQNNGKTTAEHYTYNEKGQGNRLTGIQTNNKNQSQSQYAYNADGTPKTAGKLRYEYNTKQRPIKVFKDKQLLAEYAYNCFGERIKKVVYTNSKKPTITYYLYDGHTLTAEANETGVITSQYLYLNTIQPVIKLQGRDIYAIHADHLGTPRSVTDENQKTAWKADYSPFGQAEIKTEQITLNLRFPGQYEDAETGTYYNYFRDYDPKLGRYQTSDPIGLKGGLNTYAYVGGSPIDYIDPLGLESVIPYIQELGLPGSVLDWGNQEFKPNPGRFSDPLTEQEEAWFDYFVNIYPSMVKNGATWVPTRIDPDSLTSNQTSEAEELFGNCGYKESYANFLNRRAIINAYIINHPAYQNAVRGTWEPLIVINPIALGYDIWHTITDGEDLATGEPQNPFWGVAEVASIYVGGKLIQYTYNRIVRAVGEVPSQSAINEAWQQQLPGRVDVPKGGSSRIVPGGGLAAHEAAGGHLIARHVGQSEAQLLDRLASNSRITGASSFTNRATAESAVSSALDVNQEVIQVFLSGNSNRLVINHSLSSSVGISVSRGTTSAVPASNVRVVLQRDALMSTGYRIVTGYPTL